MIFLLNDYSLKLFRFILVGSTNTLGMYTLYVIMIFAGLPYNVALIIDYVIGIIIGYLMHRYWTFAANTSVMKSFPKYCATYVGVYFINLAILNVIVHNKLLNPLLGQIVALGCVIFCSFLLQSYWVFSKNPHLGKSFKRETICSEEKKNI